MSLDAHEPEFEWGGEAAAARRLVGGLALPPMEWPDVDHVVERDFDQERQDLYDTFKTLPQKWLNRLFGYQLELGTHRKDLPVDVIGMYGRGIIMQVLKPIDRIPPYMWVGGSVFMDLHARGLLEPEDEAQIAYLGFHTKEPKVGTSRLGQSYVRIPGAMVKGASFFYLPLVESMSQVPSSIIEHAKDADDPVAAQLISFSREGNDTHSLIALINYSLLSDPVRDINRIDSNGMRWPVLT